MAYCGPLGIPLSEFLSWSDDDQDAALVWQAREARRCNGCGTVPDEWDPAKGGNPHAYTAEAAICPGCQQLDNARDREKRTLEQHGTRLILRPYQPPLSDQSGEVTPVRA